jgi:type II secretory pathway pseudopilin PulG
MPLADLSLVHRRRGFTRWELLVLVLALAVLFVLGVGPVTSYLRKHSLANAVESARTISTLLGQYANDNNGVYPVGEGTSALGTSEGIARDLLANNYAPDAVIFAVGSTPTYRGKGGTYADLSAANLSWDFTAGASSTTGLKADAPGTLPIVYTTGETVRFPANGGGSVDATISGHGPFGPRGMVAANKDTSVRFFPRTSTGDGLATGLTLAQLPAGTGSYTQVKP